VGVPLRLARTPARRRHARATALLEAVGLADRMGHVPAQLSGGEQQRVAVAVALANAPPLLLADEPTGELDSATAREIYALLRSLVERLGVTVIIVSHDPHVAPYVDRVISIRDGRTSTETVRVARQDRPPASETLSPVPGTGGSDYAEYVVVDSVGRLQLPEDLREDYRIAGRVRLERHPDGILIQPEKDDRQ
jgi:putative ABC transport system ATP-binding protein